MNTQRAGAHLLLSTAVWIGAAAGAAEPAPPETDHEPAISFAAVYTGESWQDLAGGRVRGGAFIDNLDLQLKLDGKAWGLPGTTVYLYGLYNNGHEFADPYTGSLQGISNIEAVRASRLYEAWVETPALAGGTLRMGLYNMNSEFDVNDVGALFLSPAHGIGTDFAHTGVAGPSIFPVTGLALRYRREAGDWRMQAAVLDGIPGDPADATRTYVHLGSNDGALLVGEIGRVIGPVHTSVGVWHYTTTLPDLIAVDANGEPVQHSGNTGGYAFASGSFWDDKDTGRDLSAFVRVGVSDQAVYQTHRYLGFGLVSTGPLAVRPKDRVGLAFAIAENGTPYRDAQILAGSAVDGREMDIELSYRAVVNEWLILQPDMHYVVNPGTDPLLNNAWVLGLRFQLAFGWSH
jgi:porin